MPRPGRLPGRLLPRAQLGAGQAAGLHGSERRFIFTTSAAWQNCWRSRQILRRRRALSELAAPYYSTFLRGGEGHLEVAKTLYYTRHKICHMVLALKPFGCLPSVQSDAVQASLVERFPEVSFLPIETSADGEIHAYSRVQMALSEARAKAAREFELALSPRIIRSKRFAPLSRNMAYCAIPSIRFRAFPACRLHRRQLSFACGSTYVRALYRECRFASAARTRGVTPAALGQIHSTQEIES
jgi:hypothetical protein